jgi:hypothetical protein
MVFKRTVYDMPDHDRCLIVVERKGVMSARDFPRAECNRMLEAYASISPFDEDPDSAYPEQADPFESSSADAGP